MTADSLSPLVTQPRRKKIVICCDGTGNEFGSPNPIPSNDSSGCNSNVVKLYTALRIYCLDRHPGAGTPILHWFSGTRRELRRAIDAGCWFSVGPDMLSSSTGRRLVQEMPKERVLTESDGPFTQIDAREALP